ncbi:MAG: hypothetical protein RMJ18_00170 [Candidatus Aenigmarchaeota archaeon]|nr:hypothetical protein [Candidatus Aenigmarchaeota archaeon]MDW8159833.1 hypothetical protein [Candidatus Aenigmarchaeota archaeon]
MKINVCQLGFGQQGKRNVEKFGLLKKEGYDIRLFGVVDINPDQFKKTVDGKNYLKDLFPEAKEYVGRASEFIKKYNDGNILPFDATSTVFKGKDIHVENMLAYLETLPENYIKVYAVEKPFTTSLEYTSEIIKRFKELEICPIINAVESYMPVKIATIEDIAKNGFDISECRYYRLSAVHEKSVQTGRLILIDYGGSFYDKSPHDITKFLQTYNTRYGNLPKPKILEADFDILKIITPGRKEVFVTKDGRLTFDESAKNLSDAYAKVKLKFGDTVVTFYSSHVGIKPHDLEMIESVFTPEVKKSVAEAFTRMGVPRSPEDVKGAYGINGWNIECRVEVIDCIGKNGEEVRYITQTFGRPTPSFFTVRIIDNKDVEVLQIGPSDGHKLFVKNAIDVALGKAKPLIPYDVILREAEIFDIIDKNAKRIGYQEIDLRRPEYSKLAEFIGSRLREVA